MVRIVYDRRYDIGLFGLERLHPFDSRKYGRAWRELGRELGPRRDRHYLAVDRPATDAELLLAHSPEYLATLNRSRTVAAALELPVLAWVPAWLLRWTILTPMRWAVRGTMLAARAALTDGLAINLGGGYHHAARDGAEGFCLFADVAVAVRSLRAEGLLPPGSRFVHVDLDAHQGNGVCHQFADDRDAFLYDQYAEGIYPRDPDARRRIDCDVKVGWGCQGDEYLSALRRNLPAFLDSVARSAPVGLAVYNAGTDVVAGDPLAPLLLTPADVLERDRYVVGELRRRGIPVAVVTSGGYTRESYRLIAASVAAFVREFGEPAA